MLNIRPMLLCIYKLVRSNHLCVSIMEYLLFNHKMFVHRLWNYKKPLWNTGLTCLVLIVFTPSEVYKNIILKCHDMKRIFASGCSSVFLMWLNLGRSSIIHSEVKHFFNILSGEPFMTIYISVNCIRMLSELVTDVCGQSKVYIWWKIAPGFLYKHQSPVYTVNVTLVKLLVVFT